MWTQVGVKLELQAVDPDALTAQCCPAFDFDIMIWGWSSDPDPSALLYVYTTEAVPSGSSETGYSNPAYDELYAKQQTELNFEARKGIVWQMQKIVPHHRQQRYRRASHTSSSAQGRAGQGARGRARRGHSVRDVIAEQRGLGVTTPEPSSFPAHPGGGRFYSPCPEISTAPARRSGNRGLRCAPTSLFSVGAGPRVDRRWGGIC
jgi:hypothetical protein